MTVKFLKEISFVRSKSNYSSYSTKPKLLPQYKELYSFVTANNVRDVCYEKPSRSHDMVVLVVNDYYHSLGELTELIIDTSQHVYTYLYLAVNKFYIYSDISHEEFNYIDNYDVKLVKYCHSVIADQFELTKYSVNSDDKGNVGNFMYPVTTMFFKRHE